VIASLPLPSHRINKKSTASKEIPDAGFKHARARARISI
jgi:hypothetical protein